MEVGSLGSQGGVSYTQNLGQQQHVEPRSAELDAEQTPVSSQPQISNQLSVNQEAKKPESADESMEGVYQVNEKLDDRRIQEMLDKSISEANKRLQVTSNELRYSYHKVTKTVMVKVINSDTKEVVREIPEQKALDAIAKMWELAGILVDERK